MHGQSSSCFLLYLFFVGLIAEPKSKFMVRSHFTAAVPGLIASDVNFNFSCFVHNHGFCLLQVRCRTAFASSGYHVLLKFGLQDTLSHKVLKKCAKLRGDRNFCVCCTPPRRVHVQSTLHANTQTQKHLRIRTPTESSIQGKQNDRGREIE